MTTHIDAADLGRDIAEEILKDYLSKPYKEASLEEHIAYTFEVVFTTIVKLHERGIIEGAPIQ